MQEELTGEIAKFHYATILYTFFPANLVRLQFHVICLTLLFT